MTRFKLAALFPLGTRVIMEDPERPGVQEFVGEVVGYLKSVGGKPMMRLKGLLWGDLPCGICTRHFGVAVAIQQGGRVSDD